MLRSFAHRMGIQDVDTIGSGGPIPGLVSVLQMASSLCEPIVQCDGIVGSAVSSSTIAAASRVLLFENNVCLA